jgi:hypothetical protein
MYCQFLLCTNRRRKLNIYNFMLLKTRGLWILPKTVIRFMIPTFVITTFFTALSASFITNIEILLPCLFFLFFLLLLNPLHAPLNSLVITIARVRVCERERERERRGRKGEGRESMCRNPKCQWAVYEFHDRAVACHKRKCMISGFRREVGKICARQISGRCSQMASLIILSWQPQRAILVKDLCWKFHGCYSTRSIKKNDRWTSDHSGA